ncbi:MAG: RNA polymerase sigma factor [Cellulosilyticaceae bacterium]
MEEIEIIQKVQQGDMGAFEQLFERYKTQAIRTVYLMTGDPYITEDIVQEAFATCYLSIKRLKQPDYFRPWFFKMLTRLTWRMMKKHKNLMPTEEIGELIETEGLKEGRQDQCIEAFCEKELIYSQVLRLDYKLQATVIHYYYNELTIKEIASVMGCFEGTVKSRLHTARGQLKVYLEEQKLKGRLEEVYGI